MLTDRAMPPLVSIRAFEAAARHGSFAVAARELGTSAASVSYHVRQLERAIGAQLFVRHAQRVALTPAGEIVAEDVVRAFDTLRASFVRAADADQRSLSISALPSFGASWLTPRLGRFRAAHPAIRLELDLSADPQELGTGRFDVAIRNGHGDWPGLASHALFPSIFTPLCTPGFAALAARLDEPGMLDEAPLLGRIDWWRIWCRDGGQDRPLDAERFGTSLAHEHLDIAAAIAGQGIAIGSPIIFGDEVAAGRLVAPHPRVATDGRGFWLVYPRARLASAKLIKLRDWLLAEAATSAGAWHDTSRGQNG